MEKSIKHFPLRIDCRTVIYVTKDKLTSEYAEKKRKLFNSISAIEKKGGGYRVTVDVEEVRELVVSGMRLKDIAKNVQPFELSSLPAVRNSFCMQKPSIPL